MLSAEQLRAARALLKLDQKTVADKAGVSVETIKRLENTEGDLAVRLDTLTKIKEALEGAGVEFIPENGGGAGVRRSQRGKR